jgi:hypothetical protein
MRSVNTPITVSRWIVFDLAIGFNLLECYIAHL